MLFKEKGYDEFLAEQIKQGQTDRKAGRVLTAEQSRAKSQQAIKRKMQELS